MLNVEFKGELSPKDDFLEQKYTASRVFLLQDVIRDNSVISKTAQKVHAYTQMPNASLPPPGLLFLHTHLAQGW